MRVESAAVWAYIDEFSTCLGQPLPKTLYHYTDAAGILGILNTGELWATGVQYARNTVEFKRAVGAALHYVNERLESSQVQPFWDDGMKVELCADPIKRHMIFEQEILQMVCERLEHHLRADYSSCIVSFVDKHDEKEHWHAYSENGGYALGFFADKLNLLASHSKFHIFPCYYTSWDKQAQIVRGAVLGGLQGWVARINLLYEETPDLLEAWESSGDILKREADEIILIVLQAASLLKHESHQDEGEWRLLSEELTPETLDYREYRGMVMPFKALALTHQELSINRIPLNRVLVGTAEKRDLALHAVKGLLKKVGGLDVTNTKPEEEPIVSQSRHPTLLDF